MFFESYNKFKCWLYFLNEFEINHAMCLNIEKQQKNIRKFLILFKGNDPLSSAGPDRVRIGAAEFRVDTYTSVLSGTFETVASSANLIDQTFP